MTETPTNSPRPPIYAKKPAHHVRKRVTKARNVKHAKHVARHMLVRLPAQQQDVEGGPAKG